MVGLCVSELRFSSSTKIIYCLIRGIFNYAVDMVCDLSGQPLPLPLSKYIVSDSYIHRSIIIIVIIIVHVAIDTYGAVK